MSFQQLQQSPHVFNVNRPKPNNALPCHLPVKKKRQPIKDSSKWSGAGETKELREAAIISEVW